MTTHNKTNTQKIIPLGNNIDNTHVVKVQNLENKVAEQSDKLDQITALLNEISKKTSASWDNIWVQIWQICINKTDWWFEETIKRSRISYQKIIN